MILVSEYLRLHKNVSLVESPIHRISKIDNTEFVNGCVINFVESMNTYDILLRV